LRATDKKAVLVSACLLGKRCRYDGTSCSATIELPEDERAVPVCPEQLGGLPTPRPKSTITTGDGRQVLDGDSCVVNEEGRDVTGNFLSGAAEAVRRAHRTGAAKAYLKENSPSCGVHFTSREFSRCPGVGVTTAMLMASQVEVIPVT